MLSSTWAAIRHTVQMVEAPCEAKFEMGRKKVIVLILLASCCKESHAVDGEIVFITRNLGVPPGPNF